MKLSDEKLDRNHRAEFNAKIKALNPLFSEYTFSNLYLFRKAHDYRVLRQDGLVFLQGVTYDGAHYLMPFDKLEDIGEARIIELMNANFSLFPVLETDLSFFNPEIFEFSYNIDDSDYIYTREKIATYPGRKLHKKRNLLKQYRTLYSYEDRKYDCEYAGDALSALDRWFELSGAPVEETDYLVCKEAIDHCLEFGLSGQVYYANGEPTGFLLGEELNSDTFVIHFAKGVTKFKGIYEHMYNSLANALPAQYEFLNFEQDLGKETLRQAKSTYTVDLQRHKYRVSLKK